MRTLALIFGFMVTMTVNAGAANSPAAPTKATLCQITHDPDLYNGKRLIFRAKYMTDHIERSLLFDDSCNDSETLSYLKEKAVGTDAFSDAANVQVPLHLTETIVATFIGIFHFREKPEMCMILNKEVCRRSFEIEKVQDLVLTMTPEGKK